MRSPSSAMFIRVSKSAGTKLAFWRAAEIRSNLSPSKMTEDFRAYWDIKRPCQINPVQPIPRSSVQVNETSGARSEAHGAETTRFIIVFPRVPTPVSPEIAIHKPPIFFDRFIGVDKFSIIISQYGELGTKVKKTAPLPRNGSMYLLKDLGSRSECWDTSQRLPPAHFKNGFTLK